MQASNADIVLIIVEGKMVNKNTLHSLDYFNNSTNR